MSWSVRWQRKTRGDGKRWSHQLIWLVTARKRIRKISNDHTASKPPCLVTANQVAHQLLINGRGEMPIKLKWPILSPISEDDFSLIIWSDLTWFIFNYYQICVCFISVCVVWYFYFCYVYFAWSLCTSLYVHWTRIFIYIIYWILNKYYYYQKYMNYRRSAWIPWNL